MVSYCPYCMGQIQDGKPCPLCGEPAHLYAPAGRHLPPGSLLLKRYRIGRVLREDDFSITYLVLDQLLNRKYMLEECFPRGFVHRNAPEGTAVLGYPGEKARIFEKAGARLLADAQAMVRIGNAPGLVKTFDAFSANHTTYIVLEYLHGETMGQQLEKRYLMPGHLLLPMMEPVLRSLMLLHAKGVMHCNITPDSIMLLKNRAKLFGTVRNLNVMRDITLTANIEFSVPELNAGYAPGPWTDTYMVCSVIYQDLTGVNPAIVNRRSAAGHSELRSPSELGASLKMKQDMAIMRGLSIHPEDRWQSMEELYDALYRVKRSAGAEDNAPAASGRVSRPPAGNGAAGNGANGAHGYAGAAEPRGKPAAKALLPVLGAALALGLLFHSVYRESARTHPPETAQCADGRDAAAPSSESAGAASRSAAEPASFAPGFAWSFSGGVLTIAGTGAMPDFNPNPEAKNGAVPWLEHRSGIQSVVIRDGVTRVGENAFRDCVNLTGASMPAGLKSIGSFAFYRCGKLRSMELPAGLTDLGSFTFYGCSGLSAVTLPSGLRSIGNQAFYHCDSLAAVDIPDGVSSIGSSAFALCGNLESVTIPPTVAYIGNSAFAACGSLAELRIPGGVRQIDAAAFAACAKLKSVEIQNGLTAIGDTAFNGCRALTEVTLPRSVRSIGSRAFSECGSLTDVFYGGTGKQWGRVDIGSGNEALANASVHFSS